MITATLFFLIGVAAVLAIVVGEGLFDRISEYLDNK